MSNKFLYWKLQSINQSDLLEVGSKEFKVYRDKFKKDFETRLLMTESETLVHYSYNAWRNPMFSKIYSLTLAFVENDKIRIKYITGEEKDLIQTFLNTVKDEYFRDYTLVHSDAEIMLPYLGIRLDINGFTESIPKDLSYKGLKPWNLTGVSIRDYYQGAGSYRLSLKELAWVFKIDANFIDPDMEFEYFKTNRITELKDSAVNEISTLVNIHRAIIKENIISETVFIEITVDGVEQEQPKNWLMVLHDSNTLTPEIQEGLRNQIKDSKKRVTKKDKENLYTILRGVMVKTDFINGNQDTKAVIQQKENEINEFINTL